MRVCIVLVCLAVRLPAEIRNMTLREAVAVALKQNPDLVLSRLDEQRAAYNVRVARDPFLPKAFVGSGLAKTFGFPMTIDGSAPSIIQARAIASIFNRPLSYKVKQAEENVKTAAIDTEAKREEIAMRTASLYLEAGRAARFAGLTRRQLESLDRVADTIRARIREGREIEYQGKLAELNRAKAAQRAEILEADQAYAEAALASVLGFNSGDRIRATEDEPAKLEVPPNEEDSVKQALDSSKDVRRLQSALVAKGFEIRGGRAAWLPQADLVAQYGLFAKFNNYEQFFQTFQRHNGEIGVSLQLPILPSASASAQASQAEIEAAKLRIQINHAKDRINLETRHSFQNLRLAERGREVARLDLDVARENVTILLARMEEGRIALAQVEEARSAEQEKWIALYDAEYTAEKAQLELLKQTGGLLAALQ